MTITVYEQKSINKNFKKIPKKFSVFFFCFFLSDFVLKNHEMRPKIESRNRASRDHELWNPEILSSANRWSIIS